MKDFFHEVAGDIFQSGSEDQAEDENNGDIVDVRLQRPQNDDGAGAVNGAERAAKKASFHEMALGYGAVNRFRCPAENGVDHEI